MKAKQVVKLLVLPLLLLAGAAAARAQGCLSYETSGVRLTGTIVRKVMPGPPNYESIRKGDKAETIWLLHLASPVCVDKNTDDINQPERNVTDLQLVLDEQQFARLRGMARGARVTLSGKLFHAHTAHHRTAVLLSVEEINKQ